jgi:3-oxoacyl-[acyl-carrier-protein] synthase II
MIDLAIRGIGPVGAFGAGVADWREALAGIRKSNPEREEIETRQQKTTWPVFRASTESLNQRLPARRRRRLDHFSRLALLGAGLALDDAGPTGITGERTAVIVASAFGPAATTFAFLDSVIDDGDSCASPTLFSSSVHNSAAARIAMVHQLSGPNLSLTQFSRSFPMALQTAALWLEEGRADAVLCGAVDEYCNVMGYCRETCTPRKKDFIGPGYDPIHDGPAPAEGSVFFYLTRADTTDTPAYGVIKKTTLDTPAPKTDLPLVLGLATDTPRKTATLPDHQNRIMIFDHLYGTFPNASAFDLAALGVMLHDQKLYPGLQFYNGIASSKEYMIPNNAQTVLRIMASYRFFGNKSVTILLSLV